MISNNFIPPHPKAVEDLLSLMAIVADVKAAAKYVEGLKAAAKEYTEASKAFVDQSQSLSFRESEVAKNSDLVTEKLATLELREKEVARQEAAAAATAAQAAANWDESNNIRASAYAFKEKLEHDRANFEQTHKSQMASLIEWEKNLKNDLEAHQTKVKALKELIHV